MSKTPPAYEVKYGYIKACIWKNATPHGTRYKVEIDRLYKDGDKWVKSQRFGRDDLLLVAKVAERAHTWIYEHSDSEKSTN